MAGFSDTAFDSNAFDVNAFDIGTVVSIDFFLGRGILMYSHEDFYFELNPNTQVIETVTGDTTITLQNHTFLVDASGGPVTMTLPAAALATGQRFDFKKIDTTVNKVTLVDPTSTIDESASVTIDLYLDELPVRSDGTEYWVI